jgi:hypothetical protein
MRSLYRLQNKSLKRVQVVKIGGVRNIDKKLNVGLLQPISLREFIRNQPADPNQFHHAVDIDNGGQDGKPVIIVMPKYLKAAEDTYHDFCSLQQKFTTKMATHSRIDSVPSNKSLCDDKYAAKMMAFLDMTTISDSDSDETNTNTASLATSRPHSAAPNR